MAPRLDALVEYLGESGEHRAAAFFSSLAAALAAADEEAALLEVFLALSTTAFQGFEFDAVVAAGVDELLAYAEQVSHTFSAGGGPVH